MRVSLSLDTLNSIDMNQVYKNIPYDYQQYYHLPAGKEHYRLLTYIASLYNNSVLADVGTNRGASALALSSNPNNTVYSFDVVDLKSGEETLPNTKFELGSFVHENRILDLIMQAKFIMLDIDHEYHNEIYLYRKLTENGWKGLLCCDDIHLNDQLKRFWSEITHKKVDVTKYGHSYGTGIVVMDDSEIELL